MDTLQRSHADAEKTLTSSLDELFQKLNDRRESTQGANSLGLYNLGNTCYANAALKFFWATRMEQREVIRAHDHRLEASFRKQRSRSEPIEGNLGSIFENSEDWLELHPERSQEQNPHLLDGQHPLVGHQHDSSEFLNRILMETIGSSRWDQDFGHFREGYSLVFEDGESKVILDPERKKVFLLPIDQAGINTLEQAIQSDQSEEVLDGNNQPLKSNGSKAPATRTLRTFLPEGSSAPEFVIVSLRRFSGDVTRRTWKVSKPVAVSASLNFPYHRFTEVLDSEGNPRVQLGRIETAAYFLKAGVIHSGGLNGGHYYTLIGHDDRDTKVTPVADASQLQWYQHNDASVTLLSLESALRQLSDHGYYFLYQKRK
jgi:ubiquitin C-terminal hydrolase